jgi:hypothetical protein
MIARWSFRVFGVLAIINLLEIPLSISFAPVPSFRMDADLLAFYTTYGRGMMIGNYLATLQLVLGLILQLFVITAIRQAEAPSGGALWVWVLGSALGFDAIATVVALFFDLPTFFVRFGNDVLVIITQIGVYGIDVANAFQAMLMAAIAVAILRLRMVPAWLGWAAWCAAILSAVGTLGLVLSTGPASARAPFTLFIAGPSQQLWLLLMGLYWLFRPTLSRPPFV